MKIGFREKLMLSGLAMVLAIVGWYYFFYQSGQERITALQFEIQQIQQKINTATASSGNLESLQAEVDTLRARTEALGEKIPSKDRFLEISAQLVQQAEKYELHVDRYVPNKEVLFNQQDAQAITQVPIQVWLTGEFFNIGQFIESFETMPFLLRAGEVQITADAATYPELDVFMTAYVYVQP